MIAIAWKIFLLVVSALAIAWGGRIALDDIYFKRWQDTHWREDNNKQWSPASAFTNRYATGLGAFIFGLALAYFVFFKTA